MKKLAILFLPLLAAACAGGGGGGGSASTSPASNFSSFSQVTPNSTTTMTGGSTQWNYTASGNTVTGGTSLGQSATGASLQFSLNASGDVTTLSVAAAQGGGASFNVASGDSIGDVTINSTSYTLARSANKQNTLWAGNDFEYQTFGYWSTGWGSGSGNLGGFTVGNPTSGSDIPTTGTATFTGSALGGYSSNGVGGTTQASMSSKVDFAARTITYATSGTRILDTGTLAPQLNTSGLFVYSAGTNQFAGAIATGDGAYKGTAVGNFYGPSAKEMGGTYNMSGATGIMTGGFGGKR